MGDGLIDRMNAAELSTAYVDDFLDSVEHLPDDIQREISCIRELDIRYQNLLSEIESLQTQYNADPDSFCPKVMCQIQMKLIYLQELGDEKLQKGQQILDTLESNQRQLDIGCKHLELEQQDDSQDNSKEAAPERASKRARRTRTDNTNMHNENSSDASSLPCPERPVLRTPGAGTCAQKKVTKKKKRKSRNVERDRDDSPTEIPIDPNEPTYCLCEQVSYGEMIGCDNDLCPIEWFHFSCVSLTNKPKGKWFCPKCRGDKATVMKPRAQFLKELQKYNKEREERS